MRSIKTVSDSCFADANSIELGDDMVGTESAIVSRRIWACTCGGTCNCGEVTGIGISEPGNETALEEATGRGRLAGGSAITGVSIAGSSSAIAFSRTDT